MSEESPPEIQNEASFTIGRATEDTLASTIFAPEEEEATKINLDTMWRVAWPTPLLLPYLQSVKYEDIALISPYNPPLWETALMKEKPLALPMPNGMSNISPNALVVEELIEPQVVPSTITTYPLYFNKWITSNWVDGTLESDEFYEPTQSIKMAGDVAQVTIDDAVFELQTRPEKWPFYAFTREGEFKMTAPVPWLPPPGFEFEREYLSALTGSGGEPLTWDFSIGQNQGFYPPPDSFTSASTWLHYVVSEISTYGDIISNGFRYHNAHHIRKFGAMPNWWQDISGVSYGIPLDGEIQVGEVIEIYDSRYWKVPQYDESTDQYVTFQGTYKVVTTRLIDMIDRPLSSGNGRELVMVFDRPVPTENTAVEDLRTDENGQPLPEMYHSYSYRMSYWANPAGTEDPNGKLDVHVEVMPTYTKRASTILAIDFEEGHYRVRYAPIALVEASVGTLYTFSYNGQDLQYRFGINHYPGLGSSHYGPPGSDFKVWIGAGGNYPVDLMADNNADNQPFSYDYPAGGSLAAECEWQEQDLSQIDQVTIPEAAVPNYQTSENTYRHVILGPSELTKKILWPDFIEQQGEQLEIPTTEDGYLILTPEVENFYSAVNPVIFEDDDNYLPNPLAARDDQAFDSEWFRIRWPNSVRWYVVDKWVAFWAYPDDPTNPDYHEFAAAILETTDNLTGERDFEVRVTIDKSNYWRGSLWDMFPGSVNVETGERKLTLLDGSSWPVDNVPGVRPHYNFAVKDWFYQDEGNLFPFSVRTLNAATDKPTVFGVPPLYQDRACPIVLYLQEPRESPLELPTYEDQP